MGSAGKPRPFNGPRPGRASAPGPSRGRGLLAPEAPRRSARLGPQLGPRPHSGSLNRLCAAQVVKGAQ